MSRICLRTAENRVSDFASDLCIEPPETLVDADFAPSEELMRFCQKNNLSLDWVFLGGTKGVQSQLLAVVANRNPSARSTTVRKVVVSSGMPWQGTPRPLRSKFAIYIMGAVRLTSLAAWGLVFSNLEQVGRPLLDDVRNSIKFGSREPALLAKRLGTNCSILLCPW